MRVSSPPRAIAHRPALAPRATTKHARARAKKPYVPSIVFARPRPRSSVVGFAPLTHPPSPLALHPSPCAANIGVGVTQEAQDIFDALARTLPCAWDGQDIAVMDEVRIRAPYAKCEGVPGGDPRAVERVQKVLENEKSKLMKAGAK